jgi:hypothetical protein
MATDMSFFGLEGYHVFITRAAGGIGAHAVKEFIGTMVLQLETGCELLCSVCTAATVPFTVPQP